MVRHVNRRRITQATIVREGDRIYIGDFVLRIELPAGASTEDESSRDQPRPADSSQSHGSMRPVADSVDESVQVPSPPRVPASSPRRRTACA